MGGPLAGYVFVAGKWILKKTLKKKKVSKADKALSKEIKKAKSKDPKFDDKQQYWDKLYKKYPNDPEKIGKMMTKKFGK